jgi:hypothetical protein
MIIVHLRPMVLWDSCPYVLTEGASENGDQPNLRRPYSLPIATINRWGTKRPGGITPKCDHTSKLAFVGADLCVRLRVGSTRECVPTDRAIFLLL